MHVGAAEGVPEDDGAVRDRTTLDVQIDDRVGPSEVPSQLGDWELDVLSLV